MRGVSFFNFIHRVFNVNWELLQIVCCTYLQVKEFLLWKWAALSCFQIRTICPLKWCEKPKSVSCWPKLYKKKKLKCLNLLTFPIINLFQLSQRNKAKTERAKYCIQSSRSNHYGWDLQFETYPFCLALKTEYKHYICSIASKQIHLK